jgi:hypothetical protein
MPIRQASSDWLGPRAASPASWPKRLPLTNQIGWILIFVFRAQAGEGARGPSKALCLPSLPPPSVSVGTEAANGVEWGLYSRKGT